MAHYLKIILCTQNSPVIQDTSLPYRQTRVCRCASRIVEDVLSPPCFWRALGFECRRQRRHVDRDWRQQSPTMVYRVGCVFEIIRQRAHLVATRLPAHACVTVMLCHPSAGVISSGFGASWCEKRKMVHDCCGVKQKKRSP